MRTFATARNRCDVTRLRALSILHSIEMMDASCELPMNATERFIATLSREQRSVVARGLRALLEDLDVNAARLT